tara:strand:- start:1220 stop:2524 length:1305 start_codon:yes stop_codon:yes gene_type:complete
MTVKKKFNKRTKIIAGVIAAAVIGFSIYTINGIVVNTNLSLTSYVPGGHYPQYPALNLKGKTKEQVVEINRGEYLVKVGDCLACHTNVANGGKPYSGGLPMQTPFGSLYSPNITPDKETGIGGWSEKDFMRAVHDGVNPRGQFYYPAFPYIFFNKLKTEDVTAIKAYLDVVPAVNQQNRQNEMMFPFNWRFLQLAWRILFFYPERTGAYQDNAAESTQWNRGAYLVEGLGHCAMCHTPSYYLLNKNVSLGAPIRKYNYTGAVIEGYLAPNISKSNIGAVPDAQLLDVFRKYSMIGGNPVQGPMADAIHDSLIHLTTADLLAMITYLKTVDSEVVVQPKAESTKVGKVIYENYCSACHNAGIGGAPRISNDLGWEKLANSGLEKLYDVAIHGGGNMPAKGTCITCSDYQIRLAVDYMVSQSRKANKPVKYVPVKK